MHGPDTRDLKSKRSIGSLAKFRAKRQVADHHNEPGWPHTSVDHTTDGVQIKPPSCGVEMTHYPAATSLAEKDPVREQSEATQLARYLLLRFVFGFSFGGFGSGFTFSMSVTASSKLSGWRRDHGRGTGEICRLSSSDQVPAPSMVFSML